VLGLDLPDWVRPVAEYMFKVGVKHTLEIAAVSVVASAVIGVVLGTLLTVRWLPLRALIRSYVEIWRGLPIIVTIFLMFFLLPTLADETNIGALRLNALNAAIVGLSLWGSAQVAEATRGAVQSIPREQHEAAAALGFGWVGRHVHVVLPQASRRLLPPLVGLLVGIIQNSTLAQVIGVPEVLETGKREYERLQQPPPFGAGNPHAFEIYGAILVFFFVISFPLTRLAAYLERRLV
jgi:polar amino acid transport system permease protein